MAEAIIITLDSLRDKRSFTSIAKPGDSVGNDIVDYFLGCVPPATHRRDMIQCGEPHSSDWDDEADGYKATYITFTFDGSVWLYAGICFLGKDEHRGGEFTLSSEGVEGELIYHTIDEENAQRAKHSNSFYEYKEGSATAEYRSMVDRAVQIAISQKSMVDAMYHMKIDNLLERYCYRLAKNFNESFIVEARVPSVLIAEPSNFPNGKKDKQNQTRKRIMVEYGEIQGLLNKIEGIGIGSVTALLPIHK
jgi:hypothetical protein